MAARSTAHRLIEAILDFYRAREHALDEARMLEAICTVLLDCRTRQPIDAPRMLPAAELLARAVEEALPGDCRSLEAPLRAASHQFHWRQNPSYNADNTGAAFMAGYGYVEFAGPKDALFHAPDIRVGLMPHETRSSDITLLALYCWCGETAIEAGLTR
jgi:hypothetical protein